MLVLGLLVDLQPNPTPAVTIIGPASLGYLVGAYVVLQLRALVFRESVITLAALVFTTGIFIQLVIVGIYTMRGLPWLTAQPVEGWNTADQLVNRFFILLYTTVMVVPIGALLLRRRPSGAFPPAAAANDIFKAFPKPSVAFMPPKTWRILKPNVASASIGRLLKIAGATFGLGML